MANRVLRDWTQSENINAISEGAEVFFTRLIMKADDFGCFFGNFKLLKAALYPLRELTNFQMEQYLKECEENNLLIRYVVENKQYVMINNFGQRLRSMKNKFPLPNDCDPRTIVSNPPPETKRNEVETETELEGEKDYFKEMLNSSHFETICRNNKLKIEQGKKILDTDFRKKADLEYPNFLEFAKHFKNWIPIHLESSKPTQTLTHRPTKRLD